MTVLIIDDEPEIRSMFANILEGKGYATVCAKNGADGLLALDKYPIDIVLSDVKMPVLDGVEFLKGARLKYKILPIFLMTGYSKYSKSELLELGATGCFEKPNVDIDLFLAELSKLAG